MPDAKGEMRNEPSGRNPWRGEAEGLRNTRDGLVSKALMWKVKKGQEGGRQAIHDPAIILTVMYRQNQEQRQYVP